MLTDMQAEPPVPHSVVSGRYIRKHTSKRMADRVPEPVPERMLTHIVAAHVWVAWSAQNIQHGQAEARESPSFDAASWALPPAPLE